MFPTCVGSDGHSGVPSSWQLWIMLLQTWAPTSGPVPAGRCSGHTCGTGVLGRVVRPRFALRGTAQPFPHATAPFSVPPAVREDPHGPRPDPRDLFSFQLRPLRGCGLRLPRRRTVWSVLSCAHWPFVCLLRENVDSGPLPFAAALSVSLLLGSDCSLRTLDTSPLSDAQFAEFLSHAKAPLFSLS